MEPRIDGDLVQRMTTGWDEPRIARISTDSSHPQDEPLDRSKSVLICVICGPRIRLPSIRRSYQRFPLPVDNLNVGLDIGGGNGKIQLV